MIGKIVKIVYSSNELETYAVIEPSVDFMRLDEVTVLEQKNTGGIDED